MSNYNNGDEVLETCIFCGNSFDETKKLGTKVVCNPDNGGCGEVYKIAMYGSTNITPKEEE